MGEVVQHHTDIQKFYSGSTVLLTGATGFVGKLVLEKLLRSCDVAAVYVLMREKKGKDVETRLNDIFQVPLFDKLKSLNPNFQKKVFIITGDCLEPNLAINEHERNKIITDVDIVIHVAASIDFLAALDEATKINVRGTRDLLRIAKEIKQLKSFVYVSSAYSNCVNKEVEERFYDPPAKPDDIISWVENKDKFKLRELKSKLKKWPNNYIITKCIAENVIKTEGEGMPIGICRPSIILTSYKEPISGWVDTYLGPAGLFISASLGLLHVFQIGPEKISDLVPVDYVVNHIIAAGWDTGKKTKNEDKDTLNEIPIYNFVSGTDNPIKWNATLKYAAKHARKFVSLKTVWYPFQTVTKYRIVLFAYALVFQLIPALFIDGFSFIFGRKTKVFQLATKGYKYTAAVGYFGLREWKFQYDNTRDLWQRMSDEDKREFEFDVKKIDWNLMFHQVMRGGRIYLLKDPLSTIPAAISKYRKLTVFHYLLVVLFIYLFYKFVQYLLYAYYF